MTKNISSVEKEIIIEMFKGSVFRVLGQYSIMLEKNETGIQKMQHF